MDKDKSIIKHILVHIENIFSAQKRFGNEISIFISDKDYFNSVCMSLLQIGELSHHLTTEFIKTHAEIPWKNIIGLRNVVVHGYGQIDTETIWATVISDIPDLDKKCLAIIEDMLP
jgi:uncharacterized protein with HEPN domain